MPGKYCVECVIRISCTLILPLLMPGAIVTSLQHTDSRQCGSSLAISDNDNYVYANLRDINIGGFVLDPVNRHSYNFSSFGFQISEAIAYAVNLVNEDPYLLPNVTLGFVLFNEDNNTNSVVAKALQFLPHLAYTSEECKPCFCSLYSEEQLNISSRNDQHVCQYDVIGVISPVLSSMTVPVSYVLSAAKIPLIGCAAANEELSDKSNHPFFLRLITSNIVRMNAMLTFIHSNGWSYASILYVRNQRGESNYQGVKYLAPRYNVCIATAHKVHQHSHFDEVVVDLKNNYIKARVVILLITFREAVPLFRALKKHDISGNFIYVCIELIGFSFIKLFKDYEKEISGAFIFTNEAHHIHKLHQQIGKQRINSTINPWLKPSLEYLFECSFADGTCDHDSSILDACDFVFLNFTSLYVDIVMVIAHAATQLLAEQCPGVTGREARACIQGEVLLKYMKNVSIEGFSGHIEFDTFGDVNKNYKIYQIVKNDNVTHNKNSSSVYGLRSTLVAVYNSSTKQLHYTGEKISWDHLTNFSHDVNNLDNSTQQPVVPISVCSKPCNPGEYQVLTEMQCCWECQKCSQNERLVHESMICVACESFAWPDADTSFTTCKDIPVTFIPLSNPHCVILISLGVVEVVCAVSVSLTFLYFRELAVIKASSIELSFLQLVAIGIGSFTIVLLQLPPSDGICGTLYFTFTMSFTWLYSPILVKSLRIYRIFLGNSRYRRNPRFISTYSQITLTMILISLQVILCVATYINYKPAAQKYQPVAEEKYVELTCDMTLPGLVSFLTYNLVLVFACSVLAFKTRKLPDNFNESWFIFICVATTLIIWLGFVPTYFTATRASVKTLMLSLAILLNHTVALVFLFIPRIYAAVHTSVEVKPTTNLCFSTQPTTSKINRAEPAPRVLSSSYSQP